MTFRGDRGSRALEIGNVSLLSSFFHADADENMPNLVFFFSDTKKHGRWKMDGVVETTINSLLKNKMSQRVEAAFFDAFTPLSASDLF